MSTINPQHITTQPSNLNLSPVSNRKTFFLLSFIFLFLVAFLWRLHSPQEQLSQSGQYYKFAYLSRQGSGHHDPHRIQGYCWLGQLC